MDEIKETLLQLCNGAVEKLIATVMQHGGTFADVVSKTQNGVNALGVTILEEYYQLVDGMYSNERDKHRVIVKNKSKTRTLITAMGNITLKRQLYLDKVEQKYFFAVDEILKLEKYSRIEQGYQAELLKNATLTSYGKASAICGNKVSRQTVFNITKQLKNIETPPPKVKERKTVGDIYFEADEDHIHMNNGKSGEVKIVYVHEGVKSVGKNRRELLNPQYFVSIDDDTDTIWNNVALYISEKYIVKGDVIISGDGATWIKNGINVFNGAVYRLDKFHVYKSITKVVQNNYKMRREIVTAINTRDTQRLNSIYSALNQSATTRVQRKTILENYRYIVNNFKCIDLAVNHCSAESHVSHVLSARMSSRPMGWNKSGAERIAKLRAYMFNNGDFRYLIMNGKQEDLSGKIICGKYSMRVIDNIDDGTSSEIWARVVGLESLGNPKSGALRGLVGRSNMKL